MKKNQQKRIGSIAVEKGFITTEQLVKALEIQARENIEQGRHRLLGQILVDTGCLSEAQLDKVLEVMSNSILHTIAMGR